MAAELRRLTRTYTHTSVYDVAPCGCKLPVPNEAYSGRVHVGACAHGRLWSVEVIPPTVAGTFADKAAWVEVVE